MKANNRTSKLAALFLALCLCVPFWCPITALAQEADTAIHIQTQEDLEELARNCQLDAWSQGKTIVLDNDLNLSETAWELLPIPTFGGTFEGNNHTISSSSLNGEQDQAGLFDTIQESAVVKNLTVVGQAASDEECLGGLASKNYGKLVNCAFEGTVQGSTSVGGLVGINETTGQMTNCRFQGTVTGDHYVGGITGQNTGSLIQCTNNGDINTTAVEVAPEVSDFSQLRTTESVPAGTDIGGIAGFSSGVIQSCENAGNVGYEHMGYNVGGIAGLSRATIRNCFVKCTVSGSDYVGGAVGSSVENTVVSDCYTLVDIPDSPGNSGAISGTEEGKFAKNYYVSDTLAGLGRISYAGKAEPISFEALTQVTGLPAEMTQFTVRFLVEGEEIASKSFSYGDSFGPDVFPEIPAKDGYFATWDTDDLTDLHFDKTVTAEYARYVMTLPSKATRDSGRPVFLLDGDFDQQAAFTASPVEKLAHIGGKNALEQWTLQCSDTSQKQYTVRYLSPDESGEGCSVFVKQDGQWKKADCATFGTYLVFSVPAAKAEIAIVPADSLWTLWLLMGLGILLLLVVLVLLGRKLRKRKKKGPSDQTSQEDPD
jgi:hypothetical protein